MDKSPKIFTYDANIHHYSLDRMLRRDGRFVVTDENGGVNDAKYVLPNIVISILLMPSINIGIVKIFALDIGGLFSESVHVKAIYSSYGVGISSYI